MNGISIKCLNCRGLGVEQRANTFDISPEECSVCSGSGKNWRYNNGAIAKYYGGPFIGSE